MYVPGKEVTLDITFQSKLAKSQKYRAEIDGLRAIAILPVVLYHASVAGFSGGYVGVDIFFVISGYLITSIIARDIGRNRFSFVSFYERRMRRIFPALFTVIFFCLVAATILFAPKDFLEFGKSLMAMTVFISNIWFRRTIKTGGYFDQTSDMLPLLHTWTLSVEEQFYIFFPLGLFLLNRWAKGRDALCLLLVILLSLLVSVWGAKYKPEGTFYLLAPRSWEFLIGAFLAIEAIPALDNRALREAMGLVGLGLIAYAVFTFNAETHFPGLNALFPCLGACLIIYSSQNGASFVKTILSFRPLVFIGVISYSLYLWHWPIIVFSKYFAAGKLSNMDTARALIASLVMAFISFEFIETPFRGPNTTISRRQIFGLGVSASVISFILGFMIYNYEGFPQRYDERTRKLVLENYDRKNDWFDTQACANYRTKIHIISDVDFCEIGNKSTKKIMFWGDSHIEQLYPLIQNMYDKKELHNKGVIFAIGAGCPLTEHMNNVKKRFHCDLFSRFAMMRAERDDIDTVFIAFSTWWALGEGELCQVVDGHCHGKLSSDEEMRRFLDELAVHTHTLRMHGKHVIVALPFPLYDKSIPDLMIRNAVFSSFEGDVIPTETTLPGFRAKIALVAKKTGADIFDPRESLCNNQNCTYQLDGVSIYKDGSHIVSSQISILEPGLLNSLNKSFNNEPDESTEVVK